MGLFGGTKIYVASTVYNLAGDEEDRPNYLKSTVAGNIITNSKFSMADSLRSSYLHGPGIGARSFYRWALLHYDNIGVPPMMITAVTPYNETDVIPQLPVEAGETAVITEIQQGLGDITYWAEQFILKNYPDRIDTEWEIDWDGTTCTVIFIADAVTANFVPAAPAFDIEGQYFYVSYDRKDSSDTIIGRSIWIYLTGSGFGLLDSAVQSTTKASKFYPFIPIRHEGKFFSETYYPDIYELSKKAYRKSSGQKLNKLIDKIKDNESIDDIDYAYIVYGVPLNVIDNSARKYLFTFFKALIADTPAESTLTRLEVKSPGTSIAKLNMAISWTGITLTSGSGLKKAGAKTGSVWLDKVGEQVSIHHQTGPDHWETVTVSNLVHKNLVYKDKSVDIKGSEALDDADESGFLVPLHYETVRTMSLVDSTQMMTAATFIVFNSYEVVKQKWYQTGIFKIFVFIAIIAITILIPPLGGAAVAAWASVGAAIGLTGLAAIIAGAIITQLVTMILMKVLTRVGVELFGDKFGQIFGAIATFVAMTMGQQMLQGATMASAWGNMMSASNLLQLTNATVNGISGYVAASTQGIIQKTQDLLEDYNKESKEISELFAQNIGYGRGVIDPMSLTDSVFGNFMETEAQFLSRTLLTGSDIAELSMEMLTNFSGYTVTTDLPLSP